MTQTNYGSDPNMNTVQREQGDQSNSGSDQAIEPSVKAPYCVGMLSMPKKEEFSIKYCIKKDYGLRISILSELILWMSYSNK